MRFPPGHFQGYSDNAIRLMHDAIRDRLAEEDRLPVGAAKTYGVREHDDFKEQADALETEFQSRGVHFTPISW
jgi:hypothetical protein